ncbi:MAG: MarR family transcriptional regulator [Acidimicrobiia bacterium]|nr:MarR family transcriptional regulator [Acidimicrobiia bacterium]
MASNNRDRRAHDLAAWEQLVRYHRRTVRAMDGRLRSTFGWSLDDYDVLHQVVVHGEPIRMGDLADRLLLANSSCTRIVGRLVEAELLRRSRGDVDRREVVVDLTPAGRRLHRRMAAVHTRDIEQLLGARLSPAGRDGLVKALTELLDEGQAPRSMT